jgi:sRNA-binding protein
MDVTADTPIVEPMIDDDGNDPLPLRPTTNFASYARAELDRLRQQVEAMRSAEVSRVTHEADAVRQRLEAMESRALHAENVARQIQMTASEELNKLRVQISSLEGQLRANAAAKR